MNAIKICRDCAWHYQSKDGDVFLCGHPSVSKIDIVTGEVSDGNYCRYERGVEGKCGDEAHNYKAKTPQ